jgi:predicted amidohydrolase YtcJ
MVRPDLEAIENDLADIRKSGLQVALHAIGDRAVDLALGLIRSLPGSPRPRLEHASVLSPELLTGLATTRPAVVVQPSFVTSDTWLPQRLGRKRLPWAYPFASLHARHVPLAGSSDAPVESVDPWTGMQAAIAPRSWESDGGSHRESLSPLAAFRLYTQGGAEALDDPEVGDLRTGARADFVLVAEPSIEAAIERGSSSVRETWCGGRRVSGGPGRSRK